MASSASRLSPRKTPKQRRGWETRQHILEAAARVFSAHGYAGGTTNRIAEAAGLSVGSLYQYFPNKDAILVELVRAHVTDGVAAIGHHLSEVQALPDRLEDRIRIVTRATIDNHRDDPGLHRVLFEESPRPRELLDELHALEAAAVVAVADLLERDPEVQVDDHRLAAWVVIATIESLTHRYLSSHLEDLDLGAFEDQLVALVTRFLYGGRPSETEAIVDSRRAGRVPG